MLARLWLMPLPSSFWVDEMGTMFVVRHGAQHPSLAVAPQVPASLYFWLPRMLDGVARLPGLTEAAYRIPSVLALGLALFLIARIAARLIHSQAGWFAVFACLAMRGFNYQAADARPYALGTLAATAGVWALIRWLDRARWPDAALFAGCAALLSRVQMIDWPFYGLFALYTAVRLARKETVVKRREAFAVWLIVVAAQIPVVWGAVPLFRQAGSHVIAPAPGLSELSRALKFGIILVSLAGAWILRRVSGAGSAVRIAPSAATLIAGWWLIQPASLFAFSWITGNSVFVDRYLSLLLPGAALTATAAAGYFLPAGEWKRAAVILAVGVFLLLGNWSEAWPPHHNSDWRGAARAVNALGFGPGLPVICPSPFIEARPPAWSPAYPLPGFLYAQLDTYPITGRPFLFPFESTRNAGEFAGGLTAQTLAPGKRFVIYGTVKDVEVWRRWFAGEPLLAGWGERKLGDFGDVEAVLFWSAR